MAADALGGGSARPELVTRRQARLVLAACLVAFAACSFSSLRRESATWDETHYFGLGDHLMRSGRWDVPGAILHPPLSYYLHGVPFLFARSAPEVWTYPRAKERDLRFLGTCDVRRGRALLASPANHDDRLFSASRSMMVALGLLLGGFVFAWAERRYGPSSAAIAAILYSFSPNILAHAHLITPDIAVTTCSFVALYASWRLASGAGVGAAALAGLALGCALLSKHSAVLLLPIGAVLWALAWRAGRRVPWKHLALALGLAAAVFLLAYRLDPAPYLKGIEFQLEVQAAGFPSYLMGEWAHGSWNYYLVALAVKTQIPLLVALVVGAARRPPRGSGGWLDDAFLLVPPLVFVVFFSFADLQLGLRYVLPALPFLFVFAAGVAGSFLGRRPARVVVAGLLVWYCASSLLIHPHYLAYFNEAAGGPARGDRWLIDSNLDWGQDLKGLKAFMDENGIARIKLRYYGTDSPERHGIAHDPLPDQLDERGSGPYWIAVSATGLHQDLRLRPELPSTRNVLQELFRREPNARIGYSIYLYRIDGSKP